MQPCWVPPSVFQTQEMPASVLFTFMEIKLLLGLGLPLPNDTNGCHLFLSEGTHWSQSSEQTWTLFKPNKKTLLCVYSHTLFSLLLKSAEMFGRAQAFRVAEVEELELIYETSLIISIPVCSLFVCLNSRRSHGAPWNMTWEAEMLSSVQAYIGPEDGKTPGTSSAHQDQENVELWWSDGLPHSGIIMLLACWI